jgi:prepilin-type N-terminal cleavage/methylation domain-containing protein
MSTSSQLQLRSLFQIQDCISITPADLNPFTPRHFKGAFTLIELMAATTVLSVVLLMMVGMQDQMSKAWSNANRRTDATREARAACLLMARDLKTFAGRGKTINRFSAPVFDRTNAPIPFFYSRDGSNGIGPGGVSGCAQFFGLIPKDGKSNVTADIALVGYYITIGTNTNANGFKSTNYNLLRYYVAPSNAVLLISNWVKSPSTDPAQLFSNSTFIQSNSETLARNACNLQITFYGEAGTITNGLNYSNNTSTAGIYGGNKIAIELSFYPEDVAQKITSSTWTNKENITRYARSFEFRIDRPKN